MIPANGYVPCWPRWGLAASDKEEVWGYIKTEMPDGKIYTQVIPVPEPWWRNDPRMAVPEENEPTVIKEELILRIQQAFLALSHLYQSLEVTREGHKPLPPVTGMFRSQIP